MNAKILIYKALDMVSEKTGILMEVQNAQEKDVDAGLKYKFEGKTYEAVIKVKKDVRTYQLPEIELLKKKYPNILIITDHIYPKIKQSFQQNGINYFELNGNVFVKEKGLYILIENASTKPMTKLKTGRAFTKTGLKLVFQFLIKEELINLSYREMAEATDIGFGNINIIMSDLKNQGFLVSMDKKSYKLIKKKELLEKWMVGYEQKLKPSLYMGTFRFVQEINSTNWRTIELRKGLTCWGGEPAGQLLTNYLLPEQLTMYSIEQRADLIKHYKMLLDINGAIAVYQKFWNNIENDETLAPILLVYVDLILTGERRCTETAQKIWNEKLEGKY
jgi:hypothetical protein